MEEINIKSEELEQVEGSKELSHLDNYTDEKNIDLDNLICNCLQYTALVGSTYNYRGVGPGCIRVVFSKNGQVIGISGKKYISKGSHITVTVRSGEQHGFQCC